ncbi:unnamed protein product [Effrenium voratum]|uniref:Calpain catalytic domain-containing protein n=1 Tax=Effrenium voratum TaxID=2562239 RepID=A0AA36HMS2_9DINO|nr:unnamed protein product [Effrenium voratum]
MDTFGGPLASQVKGLLEDGPMFDFVCERCFDTHAQEGVVTLPAVAPMIEGILQSFGRPVSSSEVFQVWTQHCDPDMHHMSLAHFKPFLRALLQDNLRELQQERAKHSVTQTLPATPAVLAPPAQLPLPTAPAAVAPPAPPSAPSTAGYSAASAKTRLEPKVQSPVRPERGPSRGRSAERPKDGSKPKKAGPSSSTKSGEGMPLSAPSAPLAPPAPLVPAPSPISQDALSQAYRSLPGLELPVEAASPCVAGASSIFSTAAAALEQAQAWSNALGEKMFVDPDFAPEIDRKAMLFPAGDLPAEALQGCPGHEQVLWQRPGEAWPRFSFCGELSEVRLGVFSDAWFVTALCSLSMCEEHLLGHPSGEEPLGVFPRVFWNPDFRQKGMYCFRFFKHGQWQYVVVDDRLPFDRKSKEPLFSHTLGLNQEPQLWVALMEKAYAKLHGAYFALWLGLVDDALEDLTSWPSEKLQLSKYAKSESRDETCGATSAWSWTLARWFASEPTRGTGRATWCSWTHGVSAWTPTRTRASSAPASTGELGLSLAGPASGRLSRRGWGAAGAAAVLRGGLAWALGGPGPCLEPGSAGTAPPAAGQRSGRFHPLLQRQQNFPPRRGAQLHPAPRDASSKEESDEQAECHDGTFFMRFDDWLQVFSHVLLWQPLRDWSCLRVHGAWAAETCGGTPIPVMQPVLATLESWARNPQCKLRLDTEGEVELRVTLHQEDARINGSAPFPFEEQLRQMFLCVMLLDEAEDRLQVFDKKRIVRRNGASAASLLSRRRSVMLRTVLPSPGTYVVVPSIWEPELAQDQQVKFLLTLHLRCDPEKFVVDAPESVGFLYEEAFRELYQPPEEAEEAPEGGDAAAPSLDEINLNKEADQIKAVQEHVAAEQDRLAQLQEKLQTQLGGAKEGDQQEAEELLRRWGLVMREQLPVPESKLKHMVDREELDREGLIAPRGMMEDMERFYDIKKGTVPQHDNLLAISKPEEPNHFKMTKTGQLRAEAIKVKATLTGEQKQAITGELEERLRKRPRMPAGLSADQKAKNREIVKRMQMKVNFLKNPRFLADRSGKDKGEPCPFWFTPGTVMFRSYEVGGLYQIQVEFRNITGISRRLRVMPCKNPAFSIKELHYDKEINSQRPELVGLDPLAAVVAPGMAAHLVVQFAPSTLNDQNECLTVCTEIGDFDLQLLSRREKPYLKIADPVDCGCMLAGNNITELVRVQNTGGEGAFRLIVDENEPPEDYYYESFPDSAPTLVVGSFRVSPASFYMDANSSVELNVRFEADKVGHHRCPLFVEGNDGVLTPLTLVAVCDAVRLELASWPGAGDLKPTPCVEGTSPWQLVPWQLNWLRGTQVGHKELRTIEIANGGFMPMRVDWVLTRPPRQVLARLATGSISRLSDRVINEIPDWHTHLPPTHSQPSCPFKVEPASVTIAPFTRSKFTFSFHSHGPVGSQSSVFAYLVARDLPDSKACLLHYNKLLEMQDEMRPQEGEYSAALPLFGSIVSSVFDRKIKATGSTHPLDLKVADPKDCAVSRVVTAVCLQGRSVGPTVQVMPRMVCLPGDVLPFVPQVREIKLHNSGTSASYFRVRLTSTVHAADAHSIDPLWVISVPEVGVKPAEPEPNPRGDPELEERRLQAARLAKSWPPLPPEPGLAGASQMPGYGALASCAVEPHEGRIPAGGVVTIRMTLRAVHECDLQGKIVIDLPLDEHSSEPAAAPLKVGLAVAVRSPRAEIRSRAVLDYGVVRAHARHTMKVELSNPTEIPMLLQLRQFKEDTTTHTFPVESHREVVNLFLEAVNNKSRDGFAAIDSNQYVEVPVKPWVHSKSGCLDKSGRRKFGGDRSEDDTPYEVGVPDEEDFVFNPGFLALWPGQSGEVEVTLRSRGVGQYNALLEAVGFNSLHAQCLEVFASVQLPMVRINTHHAHFPVTYLRTASEPKDVELRNESEMTANFNWQIPLKMEGCIECQIHPMQGSIPPRGSQKCTIIAVPTKESEDGPACLPCNLFIEEILQPLELRVTAIVYGCEVDYAVVTPAELPPQIQLRPRQPEESPCDPLGTYLITTGRASRKMPMVDFGDLPLQRAKELHVVLYNRTGIATPFSAKIEKNPAFDPLVKGRKIGDYLDAATRMYALINQSGGAEPDEETLRQTFESSPQPAGAGRDETLDGSARIKVKKLKTTLNKTKKSSNKKKRWILDDKHERQAFRSSIGADFAKQKEMKEQGRMALRAGRGFAVRVSPASDWLQPFSTAVISLTCFSDLPGLMEDELVLTLRELPGHADGEAFRIPLRLQSFGNPLYLPDQQVGLNTLAMPPRLSCGVTVPAEKQLIRRFKVGNNSAARVVVNWKVFPKSQLENMAEDRHMIHVALCGRNSEVKDPFVEAPKKEVADKDVLQLNVEEVSKALDDDEEPDPEEPFNFRIWSEQPPQILDPFALPGGQLPVEIEPEEAIVPEHGTATFSVTMTCLKATLTAANNYRYTLIGDCRFTADRAQRLAFAAENPDEEFDDHLAMDAYVAVSQDEQVKALPDIELDTAQLVDDDSDVEPNIQELKEQQQVEVPPPVEAVKKLKRSRSLAPPPQPLAVEPQLDVLATIVIDCTGDCVLPRLTVDKKGNPTVEEFPAQNKEQDDIGDTTEPPVLNAPVFKFTWPATQEGAQLGTGPVHGGALGGTQVPGISLCQVRQISFSNHNASKVTCKFRTEGPFRIQLIQQPGHHPVQNSKKGKEQNDIKQLFVLPKWETITLHVAFLPEQVPASQWHHYLTRHEHVFKGDLIVEYPRDTSGEVSTHKDDLQRIHLVGTARRPAVRVHAIPNEHDRPARLERAERPPWSDPLPVLVEFGYTHITSSVTRTRTILLSNVTNIMARWSLAHVGRKRKQSPVVGATLVEEEDFRALDEREAFEFDISAGELPGPSKDGLIPGSEERVPHWCAKTSALPHGPPFPDEERFEPQRIKISFRPKKNELYKCRFRVQVENGLTIDFICRGCGSFDEEDDNLDFHEA